MNNSGSIRVNKSKTAPAHKDYSGKCEVDGKEYWISGWRKEKDGDVWLSLAFEPMNSKVEDL